MTTKLEQAARALLAHWDTPAWRYLKPTGDLMADLREALAEQAEQEPVAWALTSENGEVLDCISHTYKVTQPCTVDYDEPLYAAPVRTKDLKDDENAIRASEREAIKMDILFALEKDTGAWSPDKAYNAGFNYALDLVEQEIDKRNQMVFNTPVRTKDLKDDEIADIVYEMNGNEPTAPFWRDLARAVIAADREKNK